MKNQRNWIGLFVLTLILVVLAACGEEDSKSETPDQSKNSDNSSVVTLKYAGLVPETHDLYVYGTKVFIEEVEKNGDGKLKIEFFPNSQLGSGADMIALANSGAADIVEAAPSYIPGKLPLSNAFQLPGAMPDAEKGSKVIWEILKDENSVIRKNDYTNNKLVPLFAATLPLYQIITTEKNPLNSFEDLKGLKLRSAGGVQDLMIKNLGAVPVAMDLSEYYQALDRGTLDGGVFNLPSLEANKTIEVMKNLTANANVTSFVAPASISEKTWLSLSTDMQKVLIEAGEKAAESLAVNVVKSNEKALQNAVDKGYNVWTLSEAELIQLNELVSPTLEQWVIDMEKLGFDGQAAIDEMNKKVEELK
ncbi:TRAP transporter substrate-binding protein DctP [Sporosarcina sp. CAU 1771]